MNQKQFYRSDQWEAFRRTFIAEHTDPDGFVHCAHCGKPILHKYDLIVHHKTELSEANYNEEPHHDRNHPSSRGERRFLEITA